MQRESTKMEIFIAIVCVLVVLSSIAVVADRLKFQHKLDHLQQTIKQLEYEIERRINP